jgi:uncharacterized membrane protein
MRRSRETLDGRWGLAIGAFLINALITGGSTFLSLILSGPMSAGMAKFNLKYARNEKPELVDIFSGFNNFLNTFVAFLLMIVFVILWSLLLIVPGIIAAISYSQTFYILADNPNIDGAEALEKSKRMMYGYKAKYFRLCLRFIPWALLCILTLGIGFLWLVPWANVTFAMFYEDIKDNNLH